MKYLRIFFLILISLFFIGCEDEKENDKDVTYTITFNTDGGTVIEKQTIKKGEKVVKPTNPEKEDCDFIGWYLGEEEYNFENEVNSNLELRAMWINYYTVTFMADGVIIKEEKVKEGKSATLPDSPSVEGKKFIDWDGNFENVHEDSIVNAVFDDLEFYVTFIVDGEDYVRPVLVKYGENAPLPEDPSKEGYNFVGWDKDITNVKEYLDVNAVFEPIVYSIKYYDGENELSEISPINYTVEDDLELSIYNKENLYFSGWYLNSDYLGDGIFNIQKGTTGDLKLYALNVSADINGGLNWWSVESYKLVKDAGKGIDEISNLPEIFEQDFYTYLKDNNLLNSEKVSESIRVTSWELFSKEMDDPKRVWNATSTGGTAAGNGYAAVFLYSEIELDENNHVIDVRGGFLGTEPYKSKYIGLLDLLAIMTSYKVTKSKYTPLATNNNASRAGLGFVLDGYFYGTQGIGASYFSKARNIIPNIYTRYSLDGEEIKTINTEELILTTPSKIGYVFDGWYIDSDCLKKLGTTAIDNPCILYAGWKELK